MTPNRRKRVLILCAGRHGRVAREILGLAKEHEVVGWLDDDPGLIPVEGLPVLGPLTALEGLVQAGQVEAAVVGLGNIRLLSKRRQLFHIAEALHLEMVRVVHPTAFVSPSSRCGSGLFLGPQAVVHCGCALGKNVSVYTASTIDHDNVIGDHVFFGPGVHTAGQVTIGAGAYLGPGVVVGSGCKIGPNCILGAGAVVVRDIPADSVAFGVPARVQGSVEAWTRQRQAN